MEDTKSLLIMVLQKVFQSRPKVVDDTYQLIYSYNSGKKEKTEYEKTLKTICELMNDKLPPQILVYLLTLVDMPKEDGCQLPIIEKMQKTHNFLPESVRPHLLGYLRNKSKESSKSPMDNNLKTDDKTMEKEEKAQTIKRSQKANEFLKPAKRPRTRKKVGKSTSPESSDENIEPMKTLLDLTANYVIKNEQKLKKMYKNKQEHAWKLLNLNFYAGDNLKQCYKVVADLNKKSKLLRMIENDNITDDIFFDEYQESDIFLKEKHMFEAVNKDPFEVTQELMDGIKMFLEK